MNNGSSRESRIRWGHVGAGALATIALACAIALAGCGQTTAAGMLSQEIEGDSATAVVTAKDGNTLTLSVGGGAPDAAGQAGGEPPAGPDGKQGAGDPAQQNGGQGGEAPAKPNGEGGDGQDGEPPAKPDGEGGETQSGEPPAKPDGEQGGEPPAKPDSSQDGAQPSGNAPDAGMPGGTEMTLVIADESIVFASENGEESPGSLEDIAEGSMLQLSVEDGTVVTKVVIQEAAGGQPGTPGGQPSAGGPGQGSSTVSNGAGATTYDADAETTGEAYSSANADENAVRVEGGAAVSIADATVTKTGDSTNSEDSDFYGLNAGILAFDGSALAIEGGTVTTDAAGANGVFAYGEGTQVNVSNTAIRTSQGNSGGIEVAGGATLTASNLDVDTQGESSAAIRSDRGGGTETVTGGTYATHGNHSPAVYSTADVTVSDATLSAENTEGVVIEGKNSVTLSNCDITGNINGNATRTGVVNNVMIYQSMSGDAAEGTGSFTMNGGSFHAAHGSLFYVTNTDATIELAGVDIDAADGQLLVAAGNDGQWGTAGKNGATVSFTARNQELSGSITVDEISSLELHLDAGSSYTGAVNADGAAGEVTLELADGATWTLDGDSYISALSGDTAGIDLNGHTLYVNGEAWSK